MQFDKEDDRDWDRAGPVQNEASLLLGELQHRVANEVACAIAAMRLAKSSGVTGPRIALFDQAVDRLEGFGQVHDVLTVRPSRFMDMGREIHRLCRGLLKGRSGLEDARVRINIKSPAIPGGPGRRLLLIAAELLHNGIRHALANRVGRLDLEVSSDADTVVLTVTDNGPGIRPNAETRGTGQGSGLVAELVRMGDGRMECDSDRFGTTFKVMLPLDGPSPVNWLVDEVVE